MRRHCPSVEVRPAHPERQHRFGLLVAGLALAAGFALPSAGGAAIDERFGEGMPLVLKDGRIANVTVHAIPFETGEAALDAATAQQLRAIFQPLATDCFLTAQAIGHVAPGITRDGDTLSAHRLARARADSIQTALASYGMPQPSVASVWDWQFLLQKSQVTLWVFSLTQGDDCEGTPLPPVEPLVAAIDEGAAGPPAEAATPSAPESLGEPPASAAAAPPTVPESLEAEVVELETLEMAEGPVSAPRELRVEEAPLPDDIEATPNAALGGETAVRPFSPLEPDPLATAAVAPLAPPTQPGPVPEPDEAPVATAALDPDPARIAGESGVPALAITFDMNSSYFPSGVGRELRAFLDSLPTDGPVEIELAGAVGTSAVRGASGAEAQRYNAWMAERRIERVAEWLAQNAGQRQLTFAERLVENDPSRQVRLRANVMSQ